MSVTTNPRPSLRVRKMDFKESWENDIRPKVREMLQEPMRPRDRDELSELYHKIYRLLNSQGHNLPEAPTRRALHTGNCAVFNAQAANDAKQSQLLFFLLLHELESYLKQQTYARVAAGYDTAFVHGYVEHWEQFMLSSKLLSAIFSSCHVSWQKNSVGMPAFSPQMLKHQTQAVGFDTTALSLLAWREVIVHPVRDKLLTALLSMISNDRHRIAVDKTLLRRALFSLVKQPVDFFAAANMTASSAGLLNAQGNVNSARVVNYYQTHFERVFLQRTEVHYQAYANKLLTEPTSPQQQSPEGSPTGTAQPKEGGEGSNSSSPTDAGAQNAALVAEARMKQISNYLQAAEYSIRAEIKRCVEYLDRCTMFPLRKVVLEVLVESKVPQLLEHLIVWINRGMTHELRLLYWLFFQSEACMGPFRKTFEEHIENEGKAAIENVQSEATKDPCVLVEVIVNVYNRFNELVRSTFDNDKQLLASVEKGCRKFVASNCLYPNMSVKGAEFLGRYCNILLRPGGASARAMGNEGFEKAAATGLTVFKLLEDRDVFATVHTHFMSNRLLFGLYDRDNELFLIQRLRELMGHDYTYKMERMYRDVVEGGAALCDAFAGYMEGRQAVMEQSLPAGCQRIEFTPLVITSGSWPVSALCAPWPEPPVLIPYLQIFKKFYQESHKTGRVLSFAPHISHGIVKGTFSTNRPKPYDFAVSAYQLTMLLLFNDTDTVPFNSFVECFGTSAASPTQQQHGGSEAVSSHTASSASPSSLPNTDPKMIVQRALGPLLKLKIVTADPPTAALQQQSFTLNTSFFHNQRKIPLHTMNVSAGDSSQGGAGGGTVVGPTDGGVDIKTQTEDRKYAIQAGIVRILKSRRTIAHADLISEVLSVLKGRFCPTLHDIKHNIEVLIDKDFLERSDEDNSVYRYIA